MNLLDGINDTEDELYTFDSIIATEDKDNALEALKKIKWKLENEGILGKEYELCDFIEKELKALNIIKDMLEIKTDSYDGSDMEFHTMRRLRFKQDCSDISEDEYDILKEVLNNGR